MELTIAVPYHNINGETVRIEHIVLSGRCIAGELAICCGDVRRMGEYGRSCCNHDIVAYGEIVRGLLLAGV
jgi:hypothetical protein